MSEVTNKRAADPESADSSVKRVKPDTVQQTIGLQEKDVGITSYISKDIARFTGLLKQRYTDFLVNEINLEGQVVHLNDEGFPNKQQRRKELWDKKKTESATTDETSNTEKNKDDLGPEANEKNVANSSKDVERHEIVAKFELDAAHRIQLLESFGEEDLSKIEKLLLGGAKFESSKVFTDKSSRGKIHQLVREAFQGKIDTKTTDKNTFQFKLLAGDSRTKNQRQQPGSRIDIGPLKEFLHFTLYKENKETMECANLISKFLRLQPKQISYAGTKDRRGVTVQRCSIHRIRVDRVNPLNQRLRGLKLGGFTYENKGLGLGDLKGNEFLITLKDVKPLDPNQPIEDVIKQSVTSLKENGFINYYGMQRFGTFSISTHTIGREILLENWKKAVELLLQDQELVTPDSKEARKIWETSKDPQKALEKMPRKCIAEFTILRFLANEKKQEDGDFKTSTYFNALMKIPRNLRVMYGHAYQSYIWNTVASRRIEMFGLRVVAGDLVLETAEDREDKKIEEDVEFSEDVRTEQYQRARAVTQEEVDNEKFSIYDVVLPSPGFDIQYPENNELLEVYTTVMAQDGLDPKNMVRKTKEFSFAGSYRHVVSKPKNVEFQVRHYEHPTEQLVYTDLELLHLRKDDPNRVISQILPGTLNGSRIAVVLKFQLDVSSYATMALREVMKADTGRHGEMCDVKVATT